jgi:hypothetical protein
MSQPLNPEDLAVESVVIDPQPGNMYMDSVIYYTNTRPVPVSNTACTSCYA